MAAMAVVLAWNSFTTVRTPEATVTPIGSTSQTPPSPSADSSPSRTQLVRLSDDLASGDASRIAPYLGVESVDVDPAFASGIAQLGVAFGDPPDVRDLGAGVYEIQAQDKAGNDWAIGLRQSAGRLLIVYAEPT